MAPLIKVVKLITNEEIIGVVQDGRDLGQGDEGYTVDNLLFITAPLKIVSTYDEVIKAHSIYLLDWIPSIEDDTVPIDKQQILTLGTPNVDLESHYYELILAKELQIQQKQEEDIEPKKEVKKETKPAKGSTQKKKLKDILKDTDFDDEDMN
jgi:hypothetical protein